MGTCRRLAACACAAGLAAAPCRAAPPAAGPAQAHRILDFTVVRIELAAAAAGRPCLLQVPLAGQPVVLSLEPHSIRSPDFRLLVDQGDGRLVPVPADPPRTWRGSVQGLAGSRVAASVIDGRLWASILTGDGESWSVEPLSEIAVDADPADHVVYRGADVVPPDRMCGTPDGPGAQPRGDGGGEGGGGGGVAGTGLKIAEIAADADVEYWEKNGSNVQFTMADIETVIAAAANIYEIEIDLTFEVTTIVVRTGDAAADPYSSAVCNTLLGQFHDRWALPPESNIQRDLSQLFTGRDLSDCLGIAYLGSTCDVPLGFGYSVAESKAPGLPFSHRTALTAHETGHNFNAAHCCVGCAGCINPPCNIMCPCIGDCSGNVTTFGPLSAPTIENYANAISCLHPLPDPLIVPVSDEFPFAVLNASIWIYVDGATVSTLAANEPSPPNALRLDAFGDGGLYQDHEIRTNFINLSNHAGAGAVVRFSSEHVGSEAGEQLLVDYWTGAPFNRWEPLASLASDGVDQSQFVMTTIPLDGLVPSPFHNQFRARFRTEVDTPGGDTTSDSWFLDNVFIGVPPAPANDLCNGAAPVSEGSVPFTTFGAHTDGVADFCGTQDPVFVNDVWFLYSPSCDVIATFSLCNAADFDSKLAVYASGQCLPFVSQACSDDAEGCGQTSQVAVQVFTFIQYLVRVGAASGFGDGTLTISCPAQCPGDIDGDELVDVTDFLALLQAWGPNPGHPADIDGDNVVGINDFLELLAHWGPC